MTRAELLAAIAAMRTVALAVAAARLGTPGGHVSEAPLAPAQAAPPASGAPLVPAPFLSGVRPSVPAGILARAVNARALERGPSCPPAEPAPAAGEACDDAREAIEIEWHGSRDP